MIPTWLIKQREKHTGLDQKRLELLFESLMYSDNEKEKEQLRFAIALGARIIAINTLQGTL